MIGKLSREESIEFLHSDSKGYLGETDRFLTISLEKRCISRPVSMVGKQEETEISVSPEFPSKGYLKFLVRD